MKIRPMLAAGVAFGALFLTACEQKISGNLVVTQGDHFLVKDTNGENRKVFSGRTSIAANSSGAITIQNKDREIEIEVPDDLIPGSFRQAFEFNLPHQRTGQPLDIVGTIVSEDRVHDRVIDQEPCQLRVCSREGRDHRCWMQSGWATVRVNRMRTIQDIRITFSTPMADGTSTPVGVFSGKRDWVEESSHREIGNCHF